MKSIPLDESGPDLFYAFEFLISSSRASFSSREHLQ